MLKFQQDPKDDTVRAKAKDALNQQINQYEGFLKVRENRDRKGGFTMPPTAHGNIDFDRLSKLLSRS